MVKTNFPKIPFSDYRNQFLAAICANIISVSHGAAIGWLSPVLVTLTSDKSPLTSGPVTVDEASWLGAIFCIGGIVSNLGTGIIANKFGAKKALCLLAIPQLGFWTILILSRQVSYLYVARICAGMAGGGTFVSVPLFIADIASKEVRGSLGSFMLFGINIGVLLGFVIGAHLSYELVPCVLIILPIIFLISIFFFPDTPQFLYMNNNEEEAKKSLQFYKNYNPNNDNDKQKLELAFQNLKSLKSAGETTDNKLSLNDFICKDGRKAIFLGIGLVAFNVLSGCFAIMNYTSSVFKESGSDLDPNTSSITVAVAQLLGTYVSALIVDRFGRKVLLSVSECATALGLITTGIYSILSTEYDLSSINWLPVASMSFAIFSASVALLPISFVVLAEILPQNIRPIASGICNSTLNILAFGQLKILPILLVTIKVYGVMWICGGICLVGFLFFIILVPETKGKSI